MKLKWSVNIDMVMITLRFNIVPFIFKDVRHNIDDNFTFYQMLAFVPVNL